MSAWGERADALQGSIDALFGASARRGYHNTAPASRREDRVFTYWWLAHLIDCRLDAYARSGEDRWLDAARATHALIIRRNGGKLVNDYFDDMLWLGLACLRLYEAGGDERYLRDARTLWQECADNGWNDLGGPRSFGQSLAWRRRQLGYKNAPANGPFAILGARLARYDEGGREDRHLELAGAAYDWMRRTLLAESGYVADGVNRQGDGGVDSAWRFSYNQGLLIGAATELGRPREALPTFRHALGEMTVPAGLNGARVFPVEGAGGDEGLFKGIFYRYAVLLAEALPSDDPDRTAIVRFVARSTDLLWDHLAPDRRAPGDFSQAPRERTHLSTQLSAVMAMEARARLESDV